MKKKVGTPSMMDALSSSTARRATVGRNGRVDAKDVTSTLRPSRHPSSTIGLVRIQLKTGTCGLAFSMTCRATSTFGSVTRSCRGRTTTGGKVLNANGHTCVTMRPCHHATLGGNGCDYQGRPCSEKRPYVCSKPLIEPTTTTTTATTSTTTSTSTPTITYSPTSTSTSTSTTTTTTSTTTTPTTTATTTTTTTTTTMSLTMTTTTTTTTTTSEKNKTTTT